MDYFDKRVVILGFARQGMALARFLAEQGARVVVSDAQTEDKLAARKAALADLTIEYVLGGHPLSLLEGCDLLCLSGGVDANSPLAQEARRRGISLSNDSQIFLEHCPTLNTVGITGSAGKTTTTTLVHRMLSVTHHPSPITPPPSVKPMGEGGVGVWLGGNIGHPLIADLRNIQPKDTVVMELSSFQLEIMTQSTRIAAILNITPNHLDRHGTMEAYTAAKYNLLRYQPQDGVAVLGWDNGVTRNLNVPAARTVYFSSEVEFETGEATFLRDDRLMWRWEGEEREICRTSAIALRGRHNILNVLAACAISGAALALSGAEAGTTLEMMQVGLRGFTGVEHRLELVRERAGVRWYNDSIATAPERVIAALQAFEEPLVLLLGGRDKKLPWEPLAELVKTRVKHTICFGEAGPMIEQALAAAGVPAAQRTLVGPLHAAVSAAAQHAASGDVVLLSPGCTGFDEFQDFAERGAKFREWVKAL